MLPWQAQLPPLQPIPPLRQPPPPIDTLNQRGAANGAKNRGIDLEEEEEEDAEEEEESDTPPAQVRSTSHDCYHPAFSEKTHKPLKC